MCPKKTFASPFVFTLTVALLPLISLGEGCSGDSGAAVPAEAGLVCQSGMLDCNQSPDDACEVNALADSSNCGSCGNACPSGSACENGVCSTCAAPGTYDCNGQASDGCEITLASDTKNCGSCSRVCATGSKCTNGMCDEQVLAHNVDEPFGIAINDTHVFFTTHDGKVVRVGKDGTGEKVLQEQRALPRALAVDASYVYWVDEGNSTNDGMVLRTGLDGTCSPASPCPVVLASGLAQPRALATDATDVYWINMATGQGNASIAKTPIAGGAVTTLASSLNRPFAIRLEGNYIYYSIEAQGIFRMNKDGTGVTQITTGTLTGCKGLVIDGNDIYFTADGRVYRVAKAGGKATGIAAMSKAPVAITADAQHAYFTAYNQVYRANKNGTCTGPCAQPIGQGKVTGIVDSVSNLAVDSTYVYWTNVYGATVVRVAK